MATAKRPPATQVYLPDALRRRLVELSERSGVSASELMRRALDEYVTRAERLLAAMAADPGFVDLLTPLEVLVVAHDTGGTALRSAVKP